MYPSALRRVFKSLSPKKHSSNGASARLTNAAPRAHQPQPIISHPIPPTHTPPVRTTPAPLTVTPPLNPEPCAPDAHVTITADPPSDMSSSDDATTAAAAQYDCYIARLSSRVDGTTDALADKPDDQPNDALETPPSSPSCTDRTISRLHRRAVRDITTLRATVVDKENDYEGRNATPQLETLPTMPLTSRRPSRNASDEVETAALPPIYVDVDPAIHFVHFQSVGSGGSGSVFFARHIETRQLVALKRVTPSTPAKRRALETELSTMHTLRHPNIVSCFAAYSAHPHVWIVMEAMDIGCLTAVLDFLRDKRFLLSEAHIAYILRETLQAVWAMHSRRCMHRDIKSDNVLVDSQGCVKLADFEYSAVLTKDVPKRNTVVGTAWWMSPETVRSSYYDYGADVWSIGILSIECAEWVPPLFGMESSTAMEVIRSGVTTQGFRRPEMWSVQFADFVRGCLTRDRDLRYTVPDLLAHPFLEKACSREQIANVFRAVKGMSPIEDDM